MENFEYPFSQRGKPKLLDDGFYHTRESVSSRQQPAITSSNVSSRFLETFRVNITGTGSNEQPGGLQQEFRSPSIRRIRTSTNSWEPCLPNRIPSVRQFCASRAAKPTDGAVQLTCGKTSPFKLLLDATARWTKWHMLKGRPTTLYGFNVILHLYL